MNIINGVYLKRWIITIALYLFVSIFYNTMAQIPMHSNDKNQALLNEPIDISGDFRNFSNIYYIADSLASYDPSTGESEIKYKRYEYGTRLAFNNILAVLNPVAPNEFPTNEYAASPVLPFSIQFVSPRTIRIRAVSRFQVKPDQESLMLINGKAPVDKDSWQYSKIEGRHQYKSKFGSVIIYEKSWQIEIRDTSGKLLTHTIDKVDDSKTFTPLLPFSFVRRFYSHFYTDYL